MDAIGPLIQAIASQGGIAVVVCAVVIVGLGRALNVVWVGSREDRKAQIEATDRLVDVINQLRLDQASRGVGR